MKSIDQSTVLKNDVYFFSFNAGLISFEIPVDTYIFFLYLVLGENDLTKAKRSRGRDRRKMFYILQGRLKVFPESFNGNSLIG